jgi:cytidylate kinase
VIVGRDAGTAIAPDASTKLYLTAPLAIRAERRIHQTGETMGAIRERDQRDANRQNSPLRCPLGAIVINTSNCSVADIVWQVSGWVLRH